MEQWDEINKQREDRGSRVTVYLMYRRQPECADNPGGGTQG